MQAVRAFAVILSLVLTGVASQHDAQAQSASPGCGQPPLESGRRTIDVDGISRLYLTLVPRYYDPQKPTPLILAFHGWGGSETSFLREPVVRQLAEERGYIIVAPLGLGGAESDRSFASWTFPGSDTGLDGDGLNLSVAGDTPLICDPATIEDFTYPSCSNVAQSACSWTQCQTDDVAFVQRLVAEIEADFCVDQDRIFATGASNGGMFVWGLGQDARTAPLFRAIAPLIGLPHRGYRIGPARADGLPALLITATLDPTVPPGAWEDDAFTTTTDGGDFYFESATAITREWAAAQGCDTAVRARPVNTGHASFDCRSYCGAPDGALTAVLDCRMARGHDADLPQSWPLVMDFFAAQ